MSFNKCASNLVEHFGRQRPLRAGSLIVTLFGDAIAPRGGSVWLGSLIRVLDAFGVNQRLVRTSVFRLSQDGWYSATQVGRRSYYSLTETGRRRFESATRRIYRPPLDGWDESWSMVILSGGNGERREQLRKELAWLGYGAFNAGVMVHPAPDLEASNAVLRDLQAETEVVQMDARVTARNSPRKLDALVRQCWHLDALESKYKEFLQRFRPVYRATRAARRIDEKCALQVRTLLIHEYRKVLLRDPQLPVELLPSNWAGTASYQLCRNLYTLIRPQSEQYLSDTLETAEGPLPVPERYFFERFGGLPGG